MPKGSESQPLLREGGGINNSNNSSSPNHNAHGGENGQALPSTNNSSAEMMSDAKNNKQGDGNSKMRLVANRLFDDTPVISNVAMSRNNRRAADRAPEPAVATVSTGARTYVPENSKIPNSAVVGVPIASNESPNTKRPNGLTNEWEAAARGSVSFFVPSRRAAELAHFGIYSPIVDPTAVARAQQQQQAADHTNASFASSYSINSAHGGPRGPTTQSGKVRRRNVLVKGAGGHDVVKHITSIVNEDAFNAPSASTASFVAAGGINPSHPTSDLSNTRGSMGAQSHHDGQILVGPSGAQLTHRGTLPDTSYGATYTKKVRKSHQPKVMDHNNSMPTSALEAGYGGGGHQGNGVGGDSMESTGVHPNGARRGVTERPQSDSGQEHSGSGEASRYGTNNNSIALGHTEKAFLNEYGGGDDDHGGPSHNYTQSHLGAKSAHAETVFSIPGVEEHLLGTLQATAIAGNDISSSCLYATGIVAGAAGKYGAISSALVCTVLFFFRGIYSEVFSALPMNGGTYSSLLNVASKNWAALAAVLSTLSYTATAVTSAASAADYLHYGFPDVPSEPMCIAVLCFFALLTLMGMKDSANTAVFLFVLHLCCMFALVVASIVFCVKDKFNILHNSWYSESDYAIPYSSWVPCLFYGYASALLGVTGFETSANYIEEQKPGVFPKTLNWMWLVITLMNPTIAILAMGVVPIEELVINGNYSLAFVANRAVGDWFRTVIVLDSFLVLSGAVLTAYVGITGMHRRLALDRIMPNIFLWTNSWRHTNHVIILTFCALTVSLRLMVNDMDTLGGVYAIAFLSVMMLFCVSNLMLKWKRSRLRRTPIVHPLVPIVAGLAIMAGLVGNLIKSPNNAKFFFIYFVVFAAMVLGTKMRIMILRFVVRLIPQRWRLTIFIRESIHGIRNCPMAFFTNTASLNTLNKVVQYVVDNEDTNILKILHCFDCETVVEIDPETGKEEVVCVDPAEQEFMDRLEYECSVIDRLYPKLTVQLVFVNSPFSPLTVDEVSRELGIPKNYMFITCPGESFPHQIGQFGGIRVISH